MLNHPDVRINDASEDASHHNMVEVLGKCQATAFEPIRSIVSNLIEIKLYDCRIPNPQDDPSFQEPRRYLQLLKSYWGKCKSLIIEQIDAPLGFQPHPLTALIINLRDRIDACCEKLCELDSINENKETIDVLLDTLLSSQPDDLSAIPEWTNGQIQNVDIFIEQSRLHLGSKSYPLTHEEQLFLDQVDEAIKQYHDRVNVTWHRTLERIEAKKSALGKVDKPSPPTTFPTPAGALWEDVVIRFKDGHTVSIKVKSARGVFNYTQMGMANKKNGEPTVQWNLLRTFSNEHGVLDWSSKEADQRNQKRREILATNLRGFFRIEGDPFRLTDDGKGWQARFEILPEE
jgi:hypothetical protein